MLDVEDWAEIRRLHFAEKLPIKVIARRLGISKNTVKAKLSASEPPKYERAPIGSTSTRSASQRWACSGPSTRRATRRRTSPPSLTVR